MSSTLSRRHFLQVLGTAVAAIPLASCVAPAPAPAGTAAGEAGSAPSAGTNLVEFWAPHPLDENIKIADFVAENFTPDHPDIEFKFTRVPSEWEQKFRTAAAGGTLPDIFAVDGVNLPAYASRGLCAELDEMVVPPDVLEDFYPPARAEMQFRGKTYATVIETNSQAVRLNMDIMNEAGVQPATTWDELISVGQKLTVDANDVTADAAGFDPNTVKRWGMETWCCLGEGSTWMITPWIWMNGGEIINESDNSVHVAEEPAVQAIQFLADLVNKYYVWPKAGVVQAGPEGTWYGQLVVMSWTGAFDIANLTQGNPPNFAWDIAPFPAPAGGEPISGVGGWLMSAWNDSPRLASALEFMNFTTTPEWHRHTSKFGYAITGRKSIAEERLAEVPQLQIFLDAMATGKARPRSTQYPLITEALQQAFDATIFGGAPVEPALAEAQTKIVDALAQEEAE